MTLTEIITWMRWLNVGLAAACLILEVVTLRDWKRRTPGNRFHWMGVAMLILAAGYGSAEAIQHNDGPAVRVALNTVGLAYILFSLISKRRGTWNADQHRRMER